ncbi:origin recognition complex subunit 4 [Savitreella phatthalungensis]
MAAQSQVEKSPFVTGGTPRKRKRSDATGSPVSTTRSAKQARLLGLSSAGRTRLALDALAVKASGEDSESRASSAAASAAAAAAAGIAAAEADEATVHDAASASDASQDLSSDSDAASEAASEPDELVIEAPPPAQTPQKTVQFADASTNTTAGSTARRLFTESQKPKPLQSSPTTKSPVSAATTVASGPARLQLSSEEYAEVLSHIMPKLTGRSYPPVLGLSDASTDILTLMRECVRRGESNSAILLGPHGCGKTVVVESVLDALSKNGLHEGRDYLVVRLDGEIQTDDRAALRAVARQLQPADADSTEIASADLMTALVAILAHPSEFGESGEPLATIMLLDNFHRFAAQPRQTLLYNLFDIAQSKKAPVLVIGMTPAVDAFDMLEKRVKSRFSHRVIQLPGLPSFDIFRKVCERLLKCPAAGLAADAVESADDKATGAPVEPVTTRWNKLIDTALTVDPRTKRPPNALGNLLDIVHATTRDPRDVARSLVSPLAALSLAASGEDHGGVVVDFSTIFSHSSAAALAGSPLPDGKAGLCAGLSQLEAGLLVCAARIEIRYARSAATATAATASVPISFATTYEEYSTLSKRATVAQRLAGIANARVISRDLARASWERLTATGLLVPITGAQNTTAADIKEAAATGTAAAATAASGKTKASEFRPFKVELTLMELVAALRKVPGMPASLIAWAREVT